MITTETREIYTTSDGEEFEILVDAEEHDHYLSVERPRAVALTEKANQLWKSGASLLKCVQCFDVETLLPVVASLVRGQHLSLKASFNDKEETVTDMILGFDLFCFIKLRSGRRLSFSQLEERFLSVVPSPAERIKTYRNKTQ